MRAHRPLKSQTTSIRLDGDLKKPIHEWLEQNPEFNLSRLANMAIKKFISKKQVLEPVKIVKASDKKVEKSVKHMMKKHAHMLEKLK
jgi:hypothetical protein